jgi:hypothetical protein
MLSFITYQNIPEQLEIVADEKGIEDLIFYLQSIRNAKDHMHLTIDSEINPYPLPTNRSNVTFAKSVRLEFANTDSWLP